MRNSWRRTLAGVGAIGLVAGLVTACADPTGGSAGGGDGGGSTDEPFNVLLVTTTSGPLGVFGTGVSNGAKAAADVLNEQGGILGREVVVTVSDMAGDASKGVTLLQQAVASGTKPDMAFLGLISSDALALAPIATQNEILSWTYTPTAKILADTESFPYTFGVLPTTQFVGSVPADAAYSDGARTAVTVATNSESGDDFSTAFAERFEELGGEILEEIKTDPAATDLTADFQRAYAAGPEAIYVYPQGQPVLALNANLAAGATIPLYSETSFAHDFRAQGVSDAALENVTGASLPLRLTTPDRRSERQVEFIEAWQALDPSETESSANAAAGYDAVMATAAAAEQAGSASAADMAAALEDLQGDISWAGGTPMLYTAEDHHVGESDAPDASPPLIAFALATAFVHEDGGYFDYDGPLTNEEIEAAQ